MQTNFYVDAFNLYYGCLKGTPHRWLDLQALFGKVFPRNNINRIRYFTAIVESRPSDVHRPVHQQAYLRALQTIPNLSIHLGQYKTRAVQLPLATPPKAGPKTARVLRTEEKGSDVNLASYLLLDVFRGDCETAIVVSNDADLKAPIEIVKDELGIPVGVLNPHPPKRQSRDLQPTFFKQLRHGPIAASQFPPILTDARGKIRKPPGW